MAEGLASPSVSSSSGFSSPAPSEILEGVVAYVEVRTANDNRSAAIQWMLQRMGARVEEKFTDGVTHVIFKEGKKRTRDKALKLGVHLVSVLWVDSCKEKQQRVPEQEFSANTSRCGTPPPGIRWKKYKSMQPRDFEDEVARSAEQCQKRQRRRDNTNLRQLLQGTESNTPFHSPSHVLVVDTQPRTPFCSADLLTPMIIPNTPPSMQARLNQLIRDKQVRRQGPPEGSPTANVSDNLNQEPLQRILFRGNTPSSEDLTTPTPADSRRKSSRISSRISISGNQRETTTNQPCNSRNSKTGDTSRLTLDRSKAEHQNDNATRTENTGAQVSKQKEHHRTNSNPVTGMSSENLSQSHTTRQKRRVVRQSLPCNFSQTVKISSSQTLSQSMQQASASAPQNAAVHPGSCTSQTESLRTSSQESLIRKRKKDSSEDVDKTSSNSSRQTPQNKKRRRNAVTSSSSLTTQEKNVTSQISDAAMSKSTRKRKLLNPSQELGILSPVSAGTATFVQPVAKEKRGRKRTSCDVDAIFPSSSLPPASKRGQGSSSQMKENRDGKRISLSQGDTSEQSLLLKDRKKSAANKRRTVNKKTDEIQSKSRNSSKGEDNQSNSSMSTTQSSSILGSSMSMIFDSSRNSFSRLPRNSIAEFQAAKPARRQQQGRKAAPFGKGRGGGVSSQDGGGGKEREGGARRMSVHPFRLTCMPSLVLTSLHRQEQDFVIGAVKKLGVFRVEDKVSKHTTHVVCGESRRTLNVLTALARGCWLVGKHWVERSLEARGWVGEEQYEMIHDFPMSKEARLAREAEEPGSYECRLFQSAGTMFVSNVCTPPRTELVKLLQLCGAKVTDSIQRADFYIGDQVHDEKNSIKPLWVLDCISEQELLPMDDYVMAINHKPKVTSSPEF